MSRIERQLANWGPVEIGSVAGVMGGTPCIKGTRVPAEIIRVSLNDGETKSDIFAAYPYLPVGAVEAVIRWAQDNGLDVTVPD